MKSICYIALALGALMAAASIDAVPDPPAVNPHTVSLKAGCLRELVDGFREQRLTCDSAYISPRVPVHRVNLTNAAEPNRPSDGIALTGHAADPSPPVLL